MVWIFNRAFFGIGRFLAHAPCIAWAANVVPLFISICKHSLPQAIPYRREIYISQGISAVLVSSFLIPLTVVIANAGKSIFLPLWMTSTGIYILTTGSLKKKGYWLILYCIIDWGMIGLLILSLIWQSYYLPSTLKACHRAKTWQLVEKETSLFWVVGRQTYRNPLNMCDEYMLVWILNICTM